MPAGRNPAKQDNLWIATTRLGKVIHKLGGRILTSVPSYTRRWAMRVRSSTSVLVPVHTNHQIDT